jgi:nicotinamide riboside transporter PnuC
MLNYLIILAIILVLIALKVTKFVVLAIVVGLVVLLIAKNGIRLFNQKKGDDGRRGEH